MDGCCEAIYDKGTWLCAYRIDPGLAGAAMAVELGTIRVTEQIDALEALPTNPVKYLVVPRFIPVL